MTTPRPTAAKRRFCHLLFHLLIEVAKVSGRLDSQAGREKITFAVGNAEGIARVDDQLDVAQQELT